MSNQKAKFKMFRCPDVTSGFGIPSGKNVEKWALKACDLLKKKPIDQAEVAILTAIVRK